MGIWWPGRGLRTCLLAGWPRSHAVAAGRRLDRSPVAAQGSARGADALDPRTDLAPVCRIEGFLLHPTPVFDDGLPCASLRGQANEQHGDHSCAGDVEISDVTGYKVTVPPAPWLTAASGRAGRQWTNKAEAWVSMHPCSPVLSASHRAYRCARPLIPSASTTKPKHIQGRLKYRL